MNQIHIDRLLKLADHLEHGQLGHKVFDFANYNLRKDGGECIGGCGYAGCAIGECPEIFPEHWEYNVYDGVPSLKAGRYSGLDSAEWFFGLNDSEAQHLFVPGAQFKTELPNDATKEQVAANIRAFVEKKQNS